MPEFVYILCALTSIACALLLFRRYRLTGGLLLFWSTWCFVCFALTNILLFVDLVILPDVDLSLVRALLSFVGTTMLLYGLVRQST
jgi:hypothetical protein